MKRTFSLAMVLVLAFSAVAMAQAPAAQPAQAPTPNPHEGMPGMPGMGMGMGMQGMGMHMGAGMPGMNMQGPQQILTEWWRNPGIANELHLTDAQKHQLEQISLTMKLSAIDGVAGAAKAYVQLRANLDADQVDDSAYNKQMADFSAAASQLIKNFGQSVLAVRKVLSAEQWNKLREIQHHHDMMGRMGGHMMPGMPEHRTEPRRPAPPQQ